MQVPIIGPVKCAPLHIRLDKDLNALVAAMGPDGEKWRMEYLERAYFCESYKEMFQSVEELLSSAPPSPPTDERDDALDCHVRTIIWKGIIYKGAHGRVSTREPKQHIYSDEFLPHILCTQHLTMVVRTGTASNVSTTWRAGCRNTWR